MKDIDLVLSSGGARGIAHIGAILELEENGYNIKSISGTSMGALVGGIYATGQFKEFKEWMESLDRKEVFNLVDFSISKKGFVKGDKVIEHMKTIIPDRNIEDLKIPYSAVATDVKNGKEIVFTEGKLYDAIRASISIPAVFKPVEHKGTYLIDGGVLNPMPFNRVKRNNGNLLVGVDVNSKDAKVNKSDIKSDDKNKPKEVVEKEKGILKRINGIIEKGKSEFYERFDNFIPKSNDDSFGFFNLSNKSISLMIHKLTELSIEKHNPDILINIPRNSFGTYDFYKAKDLIKLGREATKLALQSKK